MPGGSLPRVVEREVPRSDRNGGATGDY